MLLIIVLSVAPSPRAEAQLMFGSRSYHQENDFKVVMGVGADMMQDLADGESRFWSNPQTGHRGTITVLGSNKRGDMLCRDAEVNSKIKEHSIVYILPICRIVDGSWKISAH